MQLYYYLKNNWLISLNIGLVFLLLSPLIAIFFEAFNLNTALIKHIQQTKLNQYISNTLLLCLLVALFSVLLAIPTAFIVARYKFLMGNFFCKAFIFPLSIPTYIMGFAYVMFFEYEGLLHKILKIMGFNGSYNLDILNIYFAGIIIALALFPYLYVLIKTSFTYSLHNLLESSKSLNIKETTLFYKLILPLAKPAIIMGISLILMETLSEYGVVDYFGVDTFSVGIFRAWNGFGDLHSAVFLAICLLGFVIILIGIERFFRNNKLYQFKINVKNINIIIPLSFYKNILAFLWCTLVFGISFLLPFIILAFNFIDNIYLLDKEIFIALWNTVLLASSATIIIIFMALLIVYISKITKGKFSSAVLFMAGYGYALPGSLVAVGILVLFKYANLVGGTLNDNLEFIFRSGFLAVIFAYSIRFIALAINNMEVVYLKNNNIHETLTSLKKNKLISLFKVDIFILRKSLLVSFCLVFIDSIKELPATMILRPFNFDTLSIKTFYLANNDKIVQASVPAFILTLLGILVILILNKK